MAKRWNTLVVCCRTCGEPFEQRIRSPQQITCHAKCKERARSRQRPPKFLKVPLDGAPLTQSLLAQREFLMLHHPNGTIGYTLHSRLLDVTFPLPLTGGKRKTFVGRLTDAPFFELGGSERDGIFVPWEAPRVPIDDVYDVTYVLPAGVTQSLGQSLTVTGSQQMRSDPRVKALLATARARDMVPNSAPLSAPSGIDPLESSGESGDGE